MPKPLNNSSRYMPGLDGLRAIAVFAVIAYHLGLKSVPGGLLGVGIFFVLSGYLITDILLKQQSQHKRLDLRTFWVRRARRLLPAMMIMITVVSLWLLISDTARLVSLKGDIGSALLYTSNWYLIFHHVSYFESFGPPSPFGHLWSLAVEEQFYLVWPLLLIAALRIFPQRGKLALWMIGAASVSAGLMAVLYEPGTDPSRVYYGTDTRAFALLIGAALAVVWPSWKLSVNRISSRGRITLDAVGTAGLIVVLLMIGKTGEYDSFLYRGGMVLLAIAAAMVVAAMAHPASRLARLIGSKPLQWFGVRSYGIYLYHYPVIVLTTPMAEAGEFHPVRAMIQVVLTILIAELSWRFVEEPIRNGAFGRLFAPFKRNAHAPKLHVSQFTMLACTGVLIISCVSCSNEGKLLKDNSVQASADTAQSQKSDDSGKDNSSADLDRQPEGTEPAATKPSVTDSEGTDPNGTKPNGTKPNGTDPSVTEPEVPEVTKPSGNELEISEPTDTEANSSSSPEKPITDQPGTDNTANGSSSSGSTKPSIDKDKVKEPGKPAVSKGSITGIGDSVMLDVEPYLGKLVPGIVIDGKVGRQLSQAAAVIEELKKKRKLGATVIVELGTNGSFTSKQLNKLLAAIGKDRRILLVNTRVPRNWQDNVNEMLENAVEDQNNIVLVDWYSASSGHKEYFAKDGVHLKKAGAQFYADLLAKAIG
ncbi:acyltransferase family protein [Paenibacillus solisilvae]|uniref:Acyltransferase family protein n=1 Tax=Paenibacillus solisilvae TaxID=2486751 RepID=A0ABW0VU12_9BACL